MQDDVGTLKEQLAALRKQMATNDELLADMPEDEEGGEGAGGSGTSSGSDDGDATKNGAEAGEFLLKTPHFLLKNLHFLLKNIHS